METIHNQDWFKSQSLNLLRDQVSQQPYEGYPEISDRLCGLPQDTAVADALSHTDGPAFATPYKNIELPNKEQQRRFARQGFGLDPLGRPLHPWFSDMIRRPDIGAALGNGFYWNYGPNPTGDAIPVRHDLDEPHVLLIDRKDTGNPALTGGFCNPDEDPEKTAYRENNEEVDATVFDLRSVAHRIHKIYQGPLADIRATAHAWPETTAFLLNITGHVDTPMEWRGNADEVNRVYWQPVSQLEKMFGSHKLLVQMAIRAALTLRA